MLSSHASRECLLTVRDDTIKNNVLRGPDGPISDLHYF